MIYAFGKYELDTNLYELRSNREVCRLPARGFEVLLYLIQHRDHVVTREELLENLWPGQFISEAILNNCIMTARQAIGDSGQSQQMIKTSHGRGYRFIAQITERHPAVSPSEEPVRRLAPIAAAQQPEDRTESSSHETSSLGQQDMSQNVLAGEHALATVLCATLENVDELTDCLGVEMTQHLRQTFFSLAHEEVERHEGTLTFFGADGILMLFGQPIAYEDHARRAAFAALGLQQRLHESCTDLEVQPAVDVALRVGLHTGPMETISLTEHPWMTSMTQIETTELAVWLHYLAKAGMVLTSKATIPFVHAAVDYVEHDEIRLPGNPDPIMTYRICRPVAS